ncbi:polyprenyl synthetase family protein [Gottschalkiaceae bacterium SANA]|nr:polyprenyl synthetase family protein [Gottschalkiaceae bacterium SANA]
MNKEKFEVFLSESILQRSSYEAPVIDAMRYSLLAGGKRIRPALMVAAYRLFQDQEEVVYPYAAALEMIHTYSLIHDDLPAMDDDDLRRGRPSCHIAHGEANAILAGDGLLNQAIELVIEAGLSAEDAKIVLRAAHSLFTASGIQGMIGGQSADLLFEGKEADENDLIFIHQKKTASLIRTALEVGGIVGGASEEECETLKSLGEVIGYAFQLQDDLLDVFSTEEELGKPIGSDDKNEKLTFLKVYGVERTRETIQELFKQADKLLSSFANHQELQTIVKELLNRRC